MTSELRNIHKVIWVLITILIPILIFFSIQDLEFNQKEDQIIDYQSSKKMLIAEAENDFIKINVYRTNLQLIVKTSLKTASALVYLVNKKGDKLKLLGQISTVGFYDFPLNQRVEEVLIYDKIKEVEITKLDL